MKLRMWVLGLLVFLLIACAKVSEPEAAPQGEQLEIPFTRQVGPSCVPSQVTMALNYYLDKEFTLKEVDEMVGRKDNYWTWFSQALPVLVSEGLDAYYYSTTPYADLNPDFVLEYYGQADGELINQVTDWHELNKSINYLEVNPDRFTNVQLPWQEVERAFSEGNVILMIIDYNTLVDRPGLYSGHGVTITYINETHVKFHNSNTGPNQLALKEDFISAWNAKGTDNDVIVVKGEM